MAIRGVKKVLHITNWYPNPWNPIEGIFIREQFRIFSQITDAYLVNVQVRTGDTWLKFKRIQYSKSERGYYLITKIRKAKIIEALTTLLLLFVFLKEKPSRYDIVHTHIAYPILIHYHLWKRFLRLNIVLSEHWSAYHFNFYLPEKTRKLNSIKYIFRQSLPVVTVSKALLEDIFRFAACRSFKSFVLPNAIDLDTFVYKSKQSHVPKRFFAVNTWSDIKNPFPFLEAFARLHKKGYSFHLSIGGSGPLLLDMKNFVAINGFDQRVVFLDRMEKQAIADTLVESDFYLYSSKYETFSVACAQALCCGVPLIGPPIAAILEYAGADEGVFVKPNDSAKWEETIKTLLEDETRFDRERISKRFSNRFSNAALQSAYLQILNECVRNN